MPFELDKYMLSIRNSRRSFGISTKDEELDLPSLYWFLDYTSALSNSALLLGLPNAP
jgi:hypothetical protein